MPADSLLFTALCRALRQNGWEFHRIEGREVAELGFEARSGVVRILAQAFAPIGVVGFTAEADGVPGPAYRPKLAELLMRTNLEMTIGNFEMDWDSRRVYFRTTNVFNDGAPQARILVGMLHAAVAEADRMNFLLKELAACPLDRLPSFDIGRLLRRDDLFPVAESTAS